MDKHADYGSDTSTTGRNEPSDEFLIAGLVAGDSAALRLLMRRYDKLVRYAVFRLSKRECQRDPQWLDSIASATWTGVIRSLRRSDSNPPESIRPYLMQIARNQCISELRKRGRENVSDDAGVLVGASEPIASSDEGPAAIAARLELLEAMDSCLLDLPPADRRLATQLPAITERRWRDAAGALEMQESTLRSRWKRVLETLRACVAEKTGESLAPEELGGDS